jgi:hypothetical protein
VSLHVTPTDLVLNLFYTLEMGVRIAALGPPWVLSYLRQPWNAFDAAMVLVGYTAFIPDSGSGSNTGAIRALRALRALRPLRTITRFLALRAVVVCFMEASLGLWVTTANAGNAEAGVRCWHPKKH